MNYLDAAMLVRIENDLTRRLVEEWKVDLQTLFYDTTNFDTFLSSEKPARLARRGHAKSKRNDLRIVAWRCWSPGIFISRCSRRSTKGIRTTRSPSAEFWTIWSLATECSERNVTASPWFSIRGTIRRKLSASRRVSLPLHWLFGPHSTPGSFKHSFGTVSFPAGSSFRRGAGVSHPEGSLWGEAHDCHHPEPCIATGTDPPYSAAFGQEASCSAGSRETHFPQP